MFGLFFYVCDAGFALFPLLLFVLGVINWRRKRSTGLLLRLIPFALISVLWVPVLGIRFYYKTANHLFLNTLQASNVASIIIGESSWNEQVDIQNIVAALNHPIWHVTNHDFGGPYETMTIVLNSGHTKIFRVGRHDYKGGALIEFFRPHANGNGFWADGDTYIPELPAILDNLGHPLPIRSK